MAAHRCDTYPLNQSNPARTSKKIIQVPYIGEDGKLQVSHQPKISHARRRSNPRNPKVLEKPKSESKLRKMTEILEWRQKRLEAELCRPNQQLSVFRHGSTNETTEEDICSIAKSFVSLGGALLGHFEEVAMDQFPEASQKTNFGLLIREYYAAKYIMHSLAHKQQDHKQTSNWLALQQFDHWLMELVQSFLHTSIGDDYADLIPTKDLLGPTQSLGPGPAVDYMQQTLQACLVYITDREASSKDIGELLSLQAMLKAALPPSMSQSIIYYVGTLVYSVCDHIVLRAAAIRPALESRHAQ